MFWVSDQPDKRLGTDLVTLSIKYSAIVVETMKSVMDQDIDVIIDSGYRQIPGFFVFPYLLPCFLSTTLYT